MHYINDWCRIVVAVNQLDAWSCLNVIGTSDSNYYRRHTRHCEMSDVAFRIAPPIGVLVFHAISVKCSKLIDKELFSESPTPTFYK